MVSTKSQRKQDYFDKLTDLLENYEKILIVGADNVGSKHLQGIRFGLRGKAVILMGKNTMMRKAIKGFCSKKPQFEVLLNHIVGNVGFVFTNEDLNSIREEILKNKVDACANAGSVAPCDVTVPAGPTGLDPSQTAFMQALNIATKINKGQIDILSDVSLLKTGEKVGSSEAALLQKLNIKPFSYGLIPKMVYDGGLIFKPEVLDLTTSDIVSKFAAGLQGLNSLAAGIDFPTPSTIPQYVNAAFNKILALSLATDYTFEKAQKYKEILDNPEALAEAQAAAAAAAVAAPVATSTAAASSSSAPAETKKEEKEEEEEEDIGFGLFD